MHKTLYVGNFASHQDAGAVERLLSGCGKVLRFKVAAHDDFIRRHGGFAVVEMASEDDAKSAIRVLDGSTFEGNRLTVRPASADEEISAHHCRMFTTMNMGDDPDPRKKV